MNNRLYVGNLAFHVTEDGLKNAFAPFGEITEVKVVLDRETGRSRGFGFVMMATADEAQKAIQGMNGTQLDGRALRVNEAEERGQRRSYGADRPRGSDRRSSW